MPPPPSRARNSQTLSRGRVKRNNLISLLLDPTVGAHILVNTGTFLHNAYEISFYKTLKIPPDEEHVEL